MSIIHVKVAYVSITHINLASNLACLNLAYLCINLACPALRVAMHVQPYMWPCISNLACLNLACLNLACLSLARTSLVFINVADMIVACIISVAMSTLFDVNQHKDQYRYLTYVF